MLTAAEQKQLLSLARQTLENYFAGQEPPFLKNPLPGVQEKRGAFVTLKKQGELRGCIGHLTSPYPLYQTIPELTLSAAFEDNRFLPLDYDELPFVKIEISVLSPLQKINDWRAIKLGEHGVLIKQGSRSGVFLPQVATENDWDLETFLSYLCAHKAGLAPDAYKDPQTKIYIFTTQTFSEE